jgi:hypothetical protein
MNSNKDKKYEYEEEPKSEYEAVRSAFKKTRTIPLNSIPIIMAHYFKDYRQILLLNQSHSHAVYLIQIKYLLNDSVENWIHNRDPDLARIPIIAEDIYNKKNPIETMFYLSFNKENEKFDILDGIHRLTALKLIKEENLTKFRGEDSNLLFNQYVLVNIRFNFTYGDLCNAFQNLNEARPVPELYMGKQEEENKGKIIKNIANEWCHKYKKHFSSSSKPNTGNTNRDKFVDLLDKLYDKYECKDENMLRNILDDANEDLSLNNPKVSIDALYKCKETGCYLFLLKNDKILEHINKYLISKNKFILIEK